MNFAPSILRTRPFRQANAFGLIEFMVVVAIIAVLSTLMMPFLQWARRLAETSTCSSNMRQIYFGLNGYAQENNGLLPLSLQPDPASGSSGSSVSWQVLIMRQLNVQFPNRGDKSIFICPSWRTTYPVPAYRTYALNLTGGSPTANPPRFLTLSAPSQTALLVESKHEGSGAGYNALSGSIEGNGGKARLEARHNSKMNLLTADGAVISLTTTDLSIDDLLNNIRK